MLPYFDYRPLYERLREEIDGAWQRVLASGRLILGPEVAAFEREFAAFAGAAHAVGVNSGTDALILALRALEVGPGDEVLTVASAGAPPIAAVRAAGALPRFVDVLPGSLLMDPDRLAAARTPRTRAILVVHLYGQPAPLEPILEFARREGLQLVEDCAQAHGATYRGRHVGGFGAVGAFSFYPTKNLGAFGDGGLCLTESAELAGRLAELRMYGFRAPDRHAHREGLNSRLDELQAAVLRVKLRHLAATLVERVRLAERYREGLAGSAYGLPPRTEGGTHTYHLFVVDCPDRPATIRALEQAGIGWGIHYPEPAHLMEAYRFLGYRAGDLPVTEAAAARILSLPLYPGLPEPAVDDVIRVLRTVS